MRLDDLALLAVGAGVIFGGLWKLVRLAITKIAD